MILYFSATGNSEYAAKKIAAKIGEETVDLTPLMKARDFSELISEKPWVVVSPIYVDDMADIVRDFLKRKVLKGSRKIYFVFTTGSTFSSADYTARVLCGWKDMEYMGTAGVKMPVNYPILIAAKPEEENIRCIREADPELDRLAEQIRSGEPFVCERTPDWRGKLYDLVDVMFRKGFIRGSKFYATQSCISCGKCERLCPLNNIRMKDGKPAWGEHCTHCMACVSGCPTESVEYGKMLVGKARYHFPEECRIK